VVFEDRELGIRFRYPPEYEGVRVQGSNEEGFFVNIYRKRIREDGVPGEKYFASLSITRDKEVEAYMQRAEDVEKWIWGSPFGSHIGGRLRVVEKVDSELLGGKWTYVWYVQWEPWPDDWYRPIGTLLLVKGDLAVWVDTGDLTEGKPADEVLWQQQMAFVKTIEPLE